MTPREKASKMDKFDLVCGYGLFKQLPTSSAPKLALASATLLSKLSTLFEVEFEEGVELESFVKAFKSIIFHEEGKKSQALGASSKKWL